MLQVITLFLSHDDGATVIEYGLIAALVSVAAITALGAIGGSLDSLFSMVSSELTSAATSS